MTQIVTNEFCHVCLEFTKSLRDLLKTDEETKELIRKLKNCVSEVDWSENGRLLFCDKCVRKLIKAHEFKRKCIESAETIKLYMLNKAEKAHPIVEKTADVEPLVLKYLNLKKEIKSKKPVAEEKKTVLPAVTQIILQQNNNQRLQNVVLNVLPSAAAASKNNTVSPLLGIPQVLQIPALNIIQTPAQKLALKEQDVTALLKNDKMEEVSIEIDPLDFNMEPGGEKTQQDKQPEEDPLRIDYTNEEKMEFFNSGHFLTSSDAFEKMSNFYCERCFMLFDNMPQLHHHIVEVHRSQYPYRCEDCDMDFTTKETYQSHLGSRHMNEQPSDSITLLDFRPNTSRVEFQVNPPPSFPPPIGKFKALSEDEVLENFKVGEEARCSECHKVFSSSAGMMRHKAKMHKSHKRKTFFVKGEKNAQCDICGRYFSTQSYMTLHRKLHERKVGWKRRIFKQEEKIRLLNETQDELYFEQQSDVEPVDDEDNDLKTIRLENVSNFLKKTFQQTKELSMLGENGKNRAGSTEQMIKDKGSESESTVCTYCGKVFGRKYEMRRHVFNIHKSSADLTMADEYMCPHCDIPFRTPKKLTLHVKLNHMPASSPRCPNASDPQVNCHTCLTLIPFAQLLDHQVHSARCFDAANAKFSCPGCREVFHNVQSYGRHLLDRSSTEHTHQSAPVAVMNS